MEKMHSRRERPCPGRDVAMCLVMS
jgi:hypothetical protein